MRAALLFFATCVLANAESITLTATKNSDVYSYLDMPLGTTLNVNSSANMAHSHHTVIQFTLTGLGIPAAEIGTAKLRLYAYDPGPNPGSQYSSFRPGDIAIHRQGGPWEEVKLRWNHLMPQEKVAVLSVPDNDLWLEVDVTSLVREWSAGTKVNYGFLLRPETENVEPGMSVEFIGRNVPSYGPKLVITRAEPPTIPPVVGISKQSGQIVIEWPVAGSTGWTLQEAGDLNGGWAATPTAATQSAGMWRVSRPMGGETKRFFRLNKP